MLIIGSIRIKYWSDFSILRFCIIKLFIKNSDLDMIDYIKISEKEFSIILTKSDKCSINIKNQQIKNINSLLKVFDKNSLSILSRISTSSIGAISLQKEILSGISIE